MELYICKLHNSLPGHDKVYVVQVEKFTPTPGDRMFRITGSWGRRGATLQSQGKGVSGSLGHAMTTVQALIEEKTARGYKIVSAWGADEVKAAGQMPHIPFWAIAESSKPVKHDPNATIPAPKPKPVKKVKPAKKLVPFPHAVHLTPEPAALPALEPLPEPVVPSGRRRLRL